MTIGQMSDTPGRGLLETSPLGKILSQRRPSTATCPSTPLAHTLWRERGGIVLRKYHDLSLFMWFIRVTGQNKTSSHWLHFRPLQSPLHQNGNGGLNIGSKDSEHGFHNCVLFCVSLYYEERFFLRLQIGFLVLSMIICTMILVGSTIAWLVSVSISSRQTGQNKANSQWLHLRPLLRAPASNW